MRRDEIKNDVIGRYSQPRFRTWLKKCITAMYNRLRYKIINIIYLHARVCVFNYVCIYIRVCVCVDV